MRGLDFKKNLGNLLADLDFVDRISKPEQALSTPDGLYTEGRGWPTMSDQATAARSSFQPRPGIQGLATAYLCTCLEDRITVIETGCWEQSGTDNGKGYGFVDLKHWPEWPERCVQLHRLVYRLCVGPIPDGLCVLHRCDNPPCCRPDHLFLGTDLDNTADKVAKGRQASGESVRVNHEHLKGEVVKTSRATAESVMEIRRREAAGESQVDLASEFGLSDTQVSSIVRGKSWAHLPVLNSEPRTVRTCPTCGAVVVTRLGKFKQHVAACKPA